MVKLNEVEKVLNGSEIKVLVNDEGLKKSEKMRQLFLGGVDVKSISELMGVRYNFVYNVVSEMIRLNDMEGNVDKKVRGSVKESIIKLLVDKKSVNEISKELKVNSNMVRKYKKENDL